jgi:two-component system sensor histidine kinase KdpD
VKSTLACTLAALLATPLRDLFDLANIVMIFLLTVLGVAVRYGRGPAVLAAFLSVALFDFFFVPPRLTFAVSDVQYLLTFAVMLAVGLTSSQLTAGYKYQAHVASRRARRVRALYEMPRDLAGALLPEQIVEISDRFLTSEFGAHAAILLTDAQDRLQGPVAVTGHAPTVDLGVAQWAFDHQEAAGMGTDTLPGTSVLYLPLKAPHAHPRGTGPGGAGYGPAADSRAAPAGRHLRLPDRHRPGAGALRGGGPGHHRGHGVGAPAEVPAGGHLPRPAHPLGALVGLADAMLLTRPAPTGEQVEIAREMRDKALRMNALIDNPLDMARLQAGRVQLNHQWQPLEEVVGSALQAVEATLAGRAVTVSLAEDLPLVHIDAVLLERVLSNLLENAGKYTPAGSPVEIGARVREEVVEVWVDDHGPGVPEGRREAVFQLFERGARESATPGSASDWPSAGPPSRPTAAASGWRSAPAAAPASCSPCPGAPPQR